MLKKAVRHYPYILIAIGALLLIIKCFYSFCWSDETFYFSTTHRFYMGDDIFRDEWFPTQLSSLILLPFYALYMAIRGSNTGILLYFRILFVLMSTLNATVMFNILKRHAAKLTALACSLCLLFYTHLNIATLSYYTLSVQMFLMSMLLIYHYYSGLKKRHLVYSGVLFALSVLSLPTLCVAYFVILLFLIVLMAAPRFIKLNEKQSAALDSAHLKDIVLYTLAGIVIPAVLFLIYLLLTVPVTDFIAGIPYVLSDEEHGTSVIYPLKKFFIGINEVFGYGAYASYLLIIVSFITSFFKFSKNHLFRACIFTADLILFVYMFFCSLGHTGYIQTVLCLFTLPLFFTQEKKDFKLFFLFIVSGMIFSLTYSYSSNGYLYILSMGHFIASIGCIVILMQYAGGHLKDRDRLSAIRLICCTAVMCIVLVQTMFLRVVNIYRDAPLELLNTKITKGPAAGLYTTAGHNADYETVYDTLQACCQSANLKVPSMYPNSMEMESKNVGNIFITKLLPWGYMCTDLRCASPTTWRTAFNSERLKPYYEMNPGRYPDLILVLDEKYGSYETCGDVEADPSPNENETGGFLLEHIDSNDYKVESVPCGILYTRQ
ncbi:MAG: glycosyltransferase family 39 protein [Lachnospiraceae bacterium]|nr:glycosyltransferase family 39 protein [Lachnospiraceae bacterium]